MIFDTFYLFFSSPHHGRPVHHSSPHQASPVHISSPHYSPPVHNSSPQRSPQHNSFQGRFQNPHSSGKVIIHKSCGGVSLEPICCKKQQKSPNQETGLGNRGSLNILCNTKLVLHENEWPPYSWKNNLVSFRTFIRPLFPKPVGWLGLFLLLTARRL